MLLLLLRGCRRPRRRKRVLFQQQFLTSPRRNDLRQRPAPTHQRTYRGASCRIPRTTTLLIYTARHRAYQSDVSWVDCVHAVVASRPSLRRRALADRPFHRSFEWHTVGRTCGAARRRGAPGAPKGWAAWDGGAVVARVPHGGAAYAYIHVIADHHRAADAADSGTPSPGVVAAELVCVVLAIAGAAALAEARRGDSATTTSTATAFRDGAACRAQPHPSSGSAPAVTDLACLRRPRLRQNRCHPWKKNSVSQRGRRSGS